MPRGVVPRTVFKKGHDPRRKNGRDKGVPNKITRAVKDFLREMVEDPDVQEAFKNQIVNGDRGSMQAFLGSIHLVVGKPKESVEVSTSPSMSKLLLMALEAANKK